MKTIVFVIRDMGPARMAALLYLALQRLIETYGLGYRLVVVSEDKGRQIWQEMGIEIAHDCLVDGSDIDVIKRKISWDDVALVITAIGLPFKVEKAFLEEAISAGKKTVVLEDQQGNRNRIRDLCPNALFSVDEVTARKAEAEGSAKRCVSVGHHAKYTEPLTPSIVARVKALRKKFGAVFVLTTNVTMTDVEAAIEFARRTGYCIIPRFHGKTMQYLVTGTQVTLEALWSEMLGCLGDQVVFLPEAKNTEEVVCAADGIIAAYSTLTYTAAFAGKRVLCTMGKESWSLFKLLTGGVPPIIESGAAYEQLFLDGSVRHIEKSGEITPYDADYAAAEVFHLL